MTAEAPPAEQQIRAAEVIATLSLATDLGMSLPLETGLQSTLVGMRLCDRLGVDAQTAEQTYYACLLFYVGCTADADVAAEVFAEDIHLHYPAAQFGSFAEVMRALARALAPPDMPPPARAVRLERDLPAALASHATHARALCEVALMLTERLGLPEAMRPLFAALSERWDGNGAPVGLRGEEIPLPVRIAHVARDATFQRALGGEQLAAEVVRERAGGAFDPEVAAALADGAGEVLALGPHSAWEETVACEPGRGLALAGDAIDDALRAMGDFADLASPYLLGHSAGVAQLAEAAARLWPLPDAEVVAVRRAGLVHDVGRVAVPAGIWLKRDPLTPDDWERVRLHAYHSERVLAHSPFLAGIGRLAGAHHERLDGSGYHRGAGAPALSPPARLLAAADACHAMGEPRPHRKPLAPERISEILAGEVRAGRLDADAVTAVLEAAGQPAPRLERPAGLTDREAEVLGLVARGLQTKQVASALGISPKTADRHLQKAYGKIGVSTRAAAALFAMEHGLVAWGELPIAGPAASP